MSSKRQEFNTIIAQRTLELLGVPHMLCRRRSCRRKNRCEWHFRASGEPCCLRNLDAGQRALVKQIHDKTRMVLTFGRKDHEHYASSWVELRELEDAAVEVARCVCPAYHRKSFNAFLRGRAKEPPPDWQGSPPDMRRGR